MSKPQLGSCALRTSGMRRGHRHALKERAATRALHTAGFMKPKQAIPNGWIWLYYLDPASESCDGHAGWSEWRIHALVDGRRADTP